MPPGGWNDQMRRVALTQARAIARMTSFSVVVHAVAAEDPDEALVLKRLPATGRKSRRSRRNNGLLSRTLPPVAPPRGQGYADAALLAASTMKSTRIPIVVRTFLHGGRRDRAPRAGDDRRNSGPYGRRVCDGHRLHHVEASRAHIKELFRLLAVRAVNSSTLPLDRRTAGPPG